MNDCKPGMLEITTTHLYFKQDRNNPDNNNNENDDNNNNTTEDILHKIRDHKWPLEQIREVPNIF